MAHIPETFLDCAGAQQIQFFYYGTNLVKIKKPNFSINSKNPVFAPFLSPFFQFWGEKTPGNPAVTCTTPYRF